MEDSMMKNGLLDMYTLGLYEKAMPAGMNWREMLTAVKEAGFDQMEISIDETDARLARLDWTKEEWLELLTAEAETGVSIRTMCLSGHRKYPLGSHDPKVRARGMEIMQKAVDQACNLGIRVIQLAGYDVYYEKGDAETLACFAENLKKSVEYAARKGVLLGFETMETPFMDTISKGMSYVTAIGSSYLGMYPDLGNLNNACCLYGISQEYEIRAGCGHMFAMHLKETEKGKYRDMDFGTGQVDFASGIRTAWECGVRMYTAEFWNDGSENWRDRLRRSCEFIREAFAEALNEK